MRACRFPPSSTPALNATGALPEAACARGIRVLTDSAIAGVAQGRHRGRGRQDLRAIRLGRGYRGNRRRLRRHVRRLVAGRICGATGGKLN